MKSLGSKTEEKLLEYVSQSTIQVGDKIPNEFELAEQFGVGRSTIREAVKSLATKGVLEVKRGSGTFVVSKFVARENPLEGITDFPDKYRLALELIDIRLMLEPEFAAQAAQNATEDEIQEIDELCRETEERYREGKNHLEKDQAFHKLIAQCSGNRVSEIMVDMLYDAITESVNLTYRTLRDETIHTHRMITDAIKNRDAVGAKYAMAMHLNYNRQMLYRIYQEKNK